MTDELQGKVAIVTGGNTGIGKAVVLALAAQGASVVIDYVSNEQATEDLERKIADLGEVATAVEADVSKVEDLQRMVDTAVSAYGRLDIMVNNAGIETRTSVLDTTEDQYEKVLAINLKSAFFGTQIGGQADDRPGSRRPHHQHDVGPRGLAHARQHGLLPFQGRHADADPDGRRRAGAAQHLRRRRRSRRGGHPDQRADGGRSRSPGRCSTAPSRSAVWPSPRRSRSVVAFLAGPGAGYVTATTIFADGGIMQSGPGL